MSHATRWTRRLRRLLGCGEARSAVGVHARQLAEFERCATLVRIVYLFAAFWVVASIGFWHEWERVEALLPLWPLCWLEHVGLQQGLRISCLLQLVTTVAAAIAPTRRVFRIGAVLGLLLWSAQVNSLSGVVSMHGLHAMIWICVALVFLPDGDHATIRSDRVRRTLFVRIIWLAQAMVLFFYSLGGCLKLAAAVVQAASGEVHAFMPEALARHVALRMQEGCTVPSYLYWGDWLMQNPAWGIVFFPLAIYLEAGSLLVAFRPSLHRAWGASLLLMHLGIQAFMAIGFPVQCMVVGLMLMASPFAHTPPGWSQCTQRLPLWGDLWFWARAARPARPAG